MNFTPGFLCCLRKVRFFASNSWQFERNSEVFKRNSRCVERNSRPFARHWAMFTSNSPIQELHPSPNSKAEMDAFRLQRKATVQERRKNEWKKFDQRKHRWTLRETHSHCEGLKRIDSLVFISMLSHCLISLILFILVENNIHKSD